MAIVEESPHHDLARYLATAIVAGRTEPLIRALRGRSGLPDTRGAAVRQALGLLTPDQGASASQRGG
jgi:hypothetical protein